jgi:serine/threonine-protein kinase
MPTYRPGDRILHKKYVVEKLLGLGGFGEVYLCKHIDLQVWRAIKLVHKGLPGVGSTVYEELFSRFQQEARIGASFQHDHLIQVYDFEQVEDSLFLVMEYAAGGTLRERIAELTAQQEWMQIEEALEITKSIANGLAALHQRQIVHRDLKPSNILFNKEGIVKIADLGLAQIPGGMSQRSRLGSMVEFQYHPGTPDYMSPEQRERFSALQPPSDIYATGLILFEMLTGKNPYYLEPGTRIRDERPEINTELNDLVQDMLQDDPRKRPWDGKRLAERIEKIDIFPEPEVVKLEMTEKKNIPAEGYLKTKEVEKVIIPPEPEPGSIKVIELGQSVSMEFVYVPAGEFWMGADERDMEAKNDEKPLHKVYLDGYWIGKYPVTNLQYSIYMSKTERKPTKHWQKKSIPIEGENHPVVNTNWYDAEDFCQWLSRKSGKIIQLPTEAQWEKAARGVDGYKYAWGNEKPTSKHANYGSSNKGTTEVDRFIDGKSPYGCFDMIGNVWEWVFDWFQMDYYSSDSNEINPKGPPLGEKKVLRGGSWGFFEGVLRATYRDRDIPDMSGNSIGFRCCLLI